MRQLFLGGVRSGKSQLAEMAATASGKHIIYIATARLLDDEMHRRCEIHRSRRPADWRLIEEPLALAETLRANASSDTCLLVDCLTLWLNNLLEESVADNEIDALLDALPELPGEILFVSSEIGLGVMPANALARQYADKLGELNQAIAQRCDRVTLAVAGLPHVLKERGNE